MYSRVMQTVALRKKALFQNLLVGGDFSFFFLRLLVFPVELLN